MVRSVSPHAYPTIYYRMLTAFGKTPLPFHITCKDKAEAANRRNEWFSFIKAIERQTKNPQLQELSKIGRGRKCSITGPNKDIIVWASRDLDSFNENLEAQLNEFEAQLETDQIEIVTPEILDIPFIADSFSDSSSLPVLNIEETLDEFLSTPEEETQGDEIFDEFLSETDIAIKENKEDSEINSLLNSPLKPIKTIVTFSKELTTEDGTEGQI